MVEARRSTTNDEYEGVSAHAGFPNPALDSTLDSLDFNRLLIKHPSATFFMAIEGDNWNDIGIFDGDIAVIDRVELPHTNDLVVWWQADSFVLGPKHAVTKGETIWGLVTSVVHRYRRNQ